MEISNKTVEPLPHRTISKMEMRKGGTGPSPEASVFLVCICLKGPHYPMTQVGVTNPVELREGQSLPESSQIDTDVATL